MDGRSAHCAVQENFLVVNKVDNAMRQDSYYSLGFDKLYNISGINGSGTGELMTVLTRTSRRYFR